MRYLWRRGQFEEALEFGLQLADNWALRYDRDDMDALPPVPIGNVLRSQGRYGEALEEDIAVHGRQMASSAKSICIRCLQQAASRPTSRARRISAGAGEGPGAV